MERDITGEMCHAVVQYLKANNNYRENYDQNKDSSYLKHWNVNNWYE